MESGGESNRDVLTGDMNCWWWVVGTDSTMKRCAALRTDRVLSDCRCWFVGTDSNMKQCAALRTDRVLSGC